MWEFAHEKQMGGGGGYITCDLNNRCLRAAVWMESLMGLLHIFKSWTSFNLRAMFLEHHAAAKVARCKGSALV